LKYGEKEVKKSYLQKTNNVIEDLVGNEENEYSVPDPSRTMINITNELSDAHKKYLKEEIMEKITKKLLEKLQDTMNQNVQDALKKYQDTTNKKLEKTQKQLNELREDFKKQ
jgi:succinate dehydrogenase/fumarate reductase flavoprotein subunit